MTLNLVPSSVVPSSSRPSTASDSNSTIQSRKFGGRQKESQFQWKHGMRHHSYDAEKAPYPVSYDRSVLELEAMDQQLFINFKRTASLVNFPEGKTPLRSLDLGCGSGVWLLDAAKEWPDCEFVGFDLVNVQLPLSMVDPSIARRISWVHGNFLTTKLPFEEEEFDHVHIRNIARGVPENKWGVLLEEISRVLCPGGVVEICEDDIIFPTLPRWFTSPLRVRTKRADSIHFPGGARQSTIASPQSPTAENIPPHDHALLESLYYSLFEHRFINIKPTALLPGYFTTYFRHVILGPVVHYPMPPFAPPLPLPKQIITSSYPIDSLDPPVPNVPPQHTRPASQTFSPTTTITESRSIAEEPPKLTEDRIAQSSSFSPVDTHEKNVPPTREHQEPRDTETPPITETARSLRKHRTMESSGNAAITQLQQIDLTNQISGLSKRSLAMQLYRGYQSVLACQEAMWEELKDRVRNKKEELKEYGWEDDEDLEELQGRKKFEKLIERYKGDMHTRISLWCSLTELGWSLPPREPLSKAELIEEERIHNAMIEAKKFASEEDLQIPSRSGRGLVGFKSASDSS